ncbi:PP2C family protein-serine/threonine phosphatase [Nitratireductor sp. GCM10026969]|uniref:PP2C family protein-serine/threonine phosphatase n=1 Tax=Nitratireductor sp. GCM10026969 TaxID=3252645 RepID=UPI00360B9524
MAGDVLLRQGEVSDSAIVILEGTVEVVAQTTSGSVCLATIREQALLGEIGILANLRRTATVRAIEPGCLLRIGRDQFNSIAEGEPQVLRYVIGQLGGQIRAFNTAVGVYTDALAALEREEFDSEMLENLNNPPAELVNFAATFKKMARQIALKRQHREEMANATAIQRAMLPQPLPQDLSRRAELFAAMRPAHDVGGDFYDAFFVDEDRLAVTIGDVSGKGVPASLFMAVCQTTIRMALREEPDDIGRALERANGLLEAENTTSTFATFFGAIVDLRTGRMSYTNCGHNPPILRRCDGGMEELASEGIALGVLSPAGYTTSETVLHRGDRLLLFTDGITEAHDAKGALFEEERLRAAFDKHHKLDARAFVEGILAETEAFAGNAPQHDDLTCLALTFLSASAGPAT